MRTDEQMLGQYQLLEQIGSGGMAEVYRARSGASGAREVAIKLLRTGFAEHAHASRRFHREVSTLPRLSHPHILSPLDWGEDEGRLYLVLPWIREGTLSQLLQTRGGFLPVGEALGLFGQLCSAVQYAHEQHIIHRDIKPHNVLVQEGTHIFLSDFGVALTDLDTRLTVTGGGVGSVSYMAPEQALGQPTGRSDLYSLGIVLYQLLTGTVPFLGDSPLQILLLQAQALPPDPRQFQPALPVGLVLVLKKALAKDPGQRFPSAQEFWEALQPFGSPAYQADGTVAGPVGEGQGPQVPPPGCTSWAAWPEDEGSGFWAPGASVTQATPPWLMRARQKTLPASRQRTISGSRRGRLSARHRVLVGGGTTAVLLLLLGAAAAGSSQSPPTTLHAGSASQRAPQPTATQPAAPTTQPTRPAGNGGRGGNGHDGGGDGNGGGNGGGGGGGAGDGH